MSKVNGSKNTKQHYEELAKLEKHRELSYNVMFLVVIKKANGSTSTKQYHKVLAK